MAFLEIRGVEKTFASKSGAVQAIAPISLSVEANEFVTILGPSGCGKSTLLHMIGGFDHPTRGEIALEGRRVGAPGPERGMMFQDLALFPWLTALENVRWPLDMKGWPMAQRLARAREAIALVHLERSEALYPAQLSGGMKQRVALARLIALDPAIMLMDEPFGALDSQTRELLQDELQSIWRDRRKTVAFVTHDIDEAIFLGTRLIIMTSRPGAVKLDRIIPAGADRAPDFRKSSDYARLRAEIWDSLREEVMKARAHVHD